MMRQGPNNKRGRGRGGNNHNGGGMNGGGSGRRPSGGMPNRNQTFDSNGPDVRIRGSAYQVHEKYLTLARDATAAGDRIMAENYYQHAEHYYRIINAQEYGPDGQRRPRPEGYNGGQNGGYQQHPHGDGPQPDLNNTESHEENSESPQGAESFAEGVEDEYEDAESDQPI